MTGDDPAPTTLGVMDVLRQAVRATTSRPLRAVLTASGTVVGVATLVATLSLTETARNQIADVFAALQLNELGVTVADTETTNQVIDASTLHEMRGRPDVEAAGILHGYEGGRPVSPSRHRPPVSMAVNTVDPTLLDVVAPRFRWGDATGFGNGARIALLSMAAAERLGMDQLDVPRSILLNGHFFLVAGVVTDVQVHSELLLGIIVDPRSAQDAGLGVAETMAVFTGPGAAAQVADALPTIVRPYQPGSVVVQQAPDPERLRQQIDSSVSQLLLLLGLVALGISGLGIANTTLTAVLERAEEIGLKRAVGARRHHIAAETVVESALLGTGGAIVGVWLGAIITAVAALVLGWRPVLLITTTWLGPLVGLAVGVIAGLYPALKAAGLEPADVLRR